MDYECRDGICRIKETSPKSADTVEVPSPSGCWTVYGRKRCFFCSAAQKLLKDESKYNYYDVDNFGGAAVVRQQLDVPESHTTVPMVFHRGTFVGGFTELKNSFERLKKEDMENKDIENREVIPSDKMTKCGGVSDPKPMTDDVTEMVTGFKEQIMARVPDEGDTFEPLSHATQVVAGVNYFVKIRVNTTTKTCIHVRIFRPLPHTGKGPELHESYQYPKTEEDALEHF